MLNLAFLAALSMPGYALCWHLFTMPIPGIADTPRAPAIAEPAAQITLDSDVKGLV